MSEIFYNLTLIDYGPKAKSEGICTLCHWSRFEFDIERLRSVYEYHYSEVHDAVDPMVKFDMALGGSSTSNWVM